MITETLSADRYMLKIKQKSKIDKHLIRDVVVGMICPHCSERMPILEHGQKYTCKKCDMEMQLFGNGLTCTLKENDNG